MQKEDLEQFSDADVTITIVQRQSVADEIELVDPYLNSTIIDEPASIIFHLKASMTLNGSYVFLICGFMRGVKGSYHELPKLANWIVLYYYYHLKLREYDNKCKCFLRILPCPQKYGCSQIWIPMTVTLQTMQAI